MKTKESIGKKVWLIVDNDCTTSIDKKDYTIVAVIDFKEAKDFCNHLIVKNEKGEQKEIRECQCIFAPNTNYEGVTQISRYLADNGCYIDDIQDNTEGIVSVEISWGDWKHSHIWCDNLMGYIGYNTACEEQVTEENGSDCYSAIHYFHKVA